MLKRLENRVAVVVGAATPRSIGAACARRYAEHGAKVVVADIAGDGAGMVADELRTNGLEATAHTVDVTNEASVQGMTSAVVHQFGRIDILHNNVVMANALTRQNDTTVIDIDMDTFDAIMAVNLRGYLLTCKYALPHMVEAGSGSVINTSSQAGTAGDLFSTAYGISKAGVNMLTQYVATQYGRSGIRCNALVIAGVLTDKVLDITDEAFRSRLSRQLLTGEIAQPSQIADAALFLASDESSYITGHLLAVDGGWGAHNPRFADTLDALTADAQGRMH